MSYYTSTHSSASNFLASSNPALLDPVAVHDYVANRSYWGNGMPFDVVERGLRNSLVVGIYDTSADAEKPRQIGCGRWITDCATFAYMSDVYIENEYQGRGLGKWLVRCMMDLPEIQGVRRMILLTDDAIGMYEKYAGFWKAAVGDGHGYTMMEKVKTSQQLIDLGWGPGAKGTSRKEALATDKQGITVSKGEVKEFEVVE
ncbi:hypothetical protein FPQ18DRAFT_332829 [Pyronema domesticum]|nr:hypothetical protein FPQ18DRAFT_332829 [Pyronema domesticum]